MPKKILFIIFIPLILLLLVIFYVTYNLQGQNPVTVNTITSSTGAQEKGVGLPVNLTIPSINVDAQVIDVGLASDGTVGVPEGPYQVAWFQLGPRPGQKGSAIITGHFGPWKSGASSVFDNLNTLKPGDNIYIKDDNGTTLTFAVKEIKVYDPGQSVPEVFTKNDGNYLNLITCNGDWVATQQTYTKRLVVFTQEVMQASQ